MAAQAPAYSTITARTCRCAACGRVFAGPQSFTRHRISTPTGRRCRTDAELRAAGIASHNSHFSQNTEGSRDV